MDILLHYAVYLVISCNTVLFTIVENHEGYAQLMPITSENMDKMIEIMSDPETLVVEFESETCPLDISI